MRLQNSVAIITGGGTGIGKAIALELCKKGANIAICGRRQEPLQQVLDELGNKHALFCIADISSEESANNFVKKTIERFGTIDILINNAGIATGGSITETTENIWNKVISVDLNGVFLMSKLVLPYMISQEGGKIINIASIAGLVAFEQNAAYAAAKGAIIQLTRQMALDYAKYNIMVNAIAPGFIETEMTKGYLQNNAYKKDILNRTPLGRIGKPEDIAHAVTFLASDDSDFMTGQTLVIDGGWTIV